MVKSNGPRLESSWTVAETSPSPSDLASVLTRRSHNPLPSDRHVVTCSCLRRKRRVIGFISNFTYSFCAYRSPAGKD
jgi:hypothetical protein